VRVLLSKVQERLRFEFDPWGRVVARHREDWHGHALVESLFFTWDDHDRLLCLERLRPNPYGPEVRRTCFAYDALGRRMAKWDAKWEASAPQGESMPTMPSLEAMPSGCTRFVWDGIRMVAELDPYNAYTTVYHPDRPYSPLTRVHQAHTEGMLHPALRLRWYLNDPVGRPRCLMDAQGSSTWQSDYLPWGKTLNEQCHLGQNQYLRFPGQYEDSETGLYYNTFRYYDPEAGRYLCPDPIGLAGGLNLYAYVFDPHSQIDPWGWASSGDYGQMPGVAGHQKHHIIPQSLAKHPVIKGTGYDVHNSKNIIRLPTSGTIDPSRTVHRGMHTKAYEKMIADELDNINRLKTSPEIKKIHIDAFVERTGEKLRTKKIALNSAC
jgi:RHS repeat-associated protein